MDMTHAVEGEGGGSLVRKAASYFSYRRQHDHRRRIEARHTGRDGYWYAVAPRSTPNCGMSSTLLLHD